MAMEEEICALKDDCMWKLVYPPKYANIIGSHWIYKVKCKSDGTLEWLKAHLVAQGYNQHDGIDFNYS